MADIGHELTEDILGGLEQRIKEEYAKALADAKEKLTKYLEKFEKGKLEQKALLDAGKITDQDYKDWLYRHTMMGQQWKDLEKVLAEDFHHANEISLQISRGQMPDVYALNANYATYQIEHGGRIDTSFTLYNHDTAELLMKEEHVQLMPRPSTKKAAEIAANKDMQWNMRKIQSSVLQGVLQGESPFEVAGRLRNVAQMDYNASVRYARTMTTSAQNAGRYQAFERAEKLGVDLTIEWQATLDNRTRHDHRMMHGQRRDVGEPFITPDGYSILWPADSSSDYTDAPQNEIWNCRCTLLSWVKGFEGDTVKTSPKMGDMTFEEWQNDKAPKEKPEENVASEATNEKDKPFTLSQGENYTVSALTEREESEFPFSDGTAYGVRKTGKATVYTTPDGVDFVFPKSYNKQHQTMTVETLLDSYNKVPQEIRTKGQRRIVVNDVYNPQDSYWRKTYKNFTHSYMTGGDQIDIWRYDYKHDPDYLGKNALPHEMGHLIDWNGTYPTGQRLSSGSDWIDAMAKDLASSGKQSPTEYGMNSNVEDFAESVSRFASDTEAFEKEFPNRFAYIVNLLNS